MVVIDIGGPLGNKGRLWQKNVTWPVKFTPAPLYFLGTFNFALNAPAHPHQPSGAGRVAEIIKGEGEKTKAPRTKKKVENRQRDPPGFVPHQ
jgi:hypothetical protein